VRVVRLEVLDHKRMLLVRPNAVDIGWTEGDTAAEVEPVASLTVRHVVLEAHERERADIDALLRAVGLHHLQDGIKIFGFGSLEEIAVFIAFGGDIARET